MRLVIEPARELRVPVTSAADQAVARSLVVRFACAAGLDRRAASELAIAASELASNILKYAGRGELVLSLDVEAVIVTSLDRGPGPPSEEELFSEGVSRGTMRSPDSRITTGRGSGGGALLRLCDEVEISARPGGGAMIRCRKLGRRPS